MLQMTTYVTATSSKRFARRLAQQRPLPFSSISIDAHAFHCKVLPSILGFYSPNLNWWGQYFLQI